MNTANLSHLNAQSELIFVRVYVCVHTSLRVCSVFTYTCLKHRARSNTTCKAFKFFVANTNSEQPFPIDLKSFFFYFLRIFFFHLTNGLLYDTLKLAAFTEIKRNREAESDSDNNIPLWFMHCFCSGRYRWFSQMCQGKNKLFILIRLVCVYAMLSLASYRMAVFMFHELSKFHSSISTHTGITCMQAFG